MVKLNSQSTCITLDNRKDLPLVESILQANEFADNSQWNEDKREYACCIVSYPPTYGGAKEYDLYTVTAVSYDRKMSSSEFIRTYARNQNSE